eukprot:gnl/Dysnectes_brevis/3739_a4795_967.p1 GENE.gnl/Dysnectes_brevis/3739_a4795_967~~gnl/Dysnectes_brevis/3739_a4795_967.p1  ORF type:complete len:1136 (-),score=236.33 gnl/Dysnectes_brevis/3739_a4795_967:39-3404(-)
MADPIDTPLEKWKLLPAFFKAQGVVRQHIDSFNHFVGNEMTKIMKANSIVRCDVDPLFFLQYTKIKVGRPILEDDNVISQVTPHECRLRDLTYAAPIYVDVVFRRGDQTIGRPNVQIGKLPIMLRSKHCVLAGKGHAALARMQECPLDPGGYFIVRGTEKVILMSEQMSMNRIIVGANSKKEAQVTVASSTHERKSRCNLIFRKKRFYFAHNTFAKEIPVVAVFKGMGVETDQEIISLIGSDPIYEDAMFGSLEEATSLGIRSQKQALVFLAKSFRPRAYATRKSKIDEARDCLASVILNHIPVLVPRADKKGFMYNWKPKVVFLATMLRRLVLHSVGLLPADDKDYYGNKRLELAGDLVSLLFEDLFKRMNSDLSRAANSALSKSNRSSPFDPVKAIRSSIITRGMAGAISSGNWSLRRFRVERSGVTQVLSRLSYIAALGQMTRLNSAFDKGRKVAAPRFLQASHFGLICPSDTPEGESVGLVKNLALLCHITVPEDTTVLRRLCYCLGVEDVGMLSGDEITKNWLVFLDGQILGVHRMPTFLLNQLRALRRSGNIGRMVSFYMNPAHQSFYIASDGGRCCRPLLVVEDGKCRLTQRHIEALANGYRSFDDLISEGVLEFLDVNEEAASFIATWDHQITKDTTHVEIDPMTILGVCAGLIPYPHHNQSPRNTYQCAMGKQAIGAIAYNQLQRIDTLLYLLVFPQKPMMKTRTIDLVKFNQLPAGQNASLAIMSFSGYDIEDALIINRSSVDRGYGRCIVLKKTTAELIKHSNQQYDRLVGAPETEPGKKVDPRFKRYHAIDVDGLPPEGSILAPGDIMVNKQSPMSTDDLVQTAESGYRDTPLSYKGPVPAHVDRVLISSNTNTHFLVKILMRATRIPELGDKFSSRHGQKGVCGLVVPQRDMPFNLYGVCPDMIMNPCGFPSRMTVGKMLELVGGKAAVLDGRQGDSTVFSGDKIEDISRVLLSHGYNYSGKDVLYSGITGEPLKAYIYAGPVYYQKLKHMAQDKLHSRARGPRATLTRQPTEGRSRSGGLRLGEMERDAVLAYGAACLLVERLMVSSDEFVAHVCGSCGLVGYKGWCQSCQTARHMVTLKLPYAAKLMMQELMAMNVVPRLELKDAI